MSDDSDEFPWPPATFGRQMQEAGEQAMEQQTELFRQLFSGGNAGGFGQLGAMSRIASFKTRVQSGGRLSIPDAEREALDIEEGDIVQTIVVPIAKGDSNE